MSLFERLAVGLLLIAAFVLLAALADHPRARVLPSCAVATPTRAHPVECQEP